MGDCLGTISRIKPDPKVVAKMIRLTNVFCEYRLAFIEQSGEQKEKDLLRNLWNKSSSLTQDQKPLNDLRRYYQKEETTFDETYARSLKNLEDEYHNYKYLH